MNPLTVRGPPVRNHLAIVLRKTTNKKTNYKVFKPNLKSRENVCVTNPNWELYQNRALTKLKALLPILLLNVMATEPAV